MFFDSLVQPSSVDIETKDDHIVQVYELAILMPVSPQQVMSLPVGRLRMPLDRTAAIEHATKLLEAAEALPEPKPAPTSDLIIPSSNINVDQVAEELANFKS
jgi:DNA-binding transcriptional regulator YdaS (Cro superfamily)